MSLPASPRSQRLRAGAAALGTLVIGGTTLLSASVAVAAPGDNGDVKVHPAGVPATSAADAPQVCSFTLAATNFETLPLITYTVTPLPRVPDRPTLAGQLALTAGTGVSRTLSLPDGTYTLAWTFPGSAPRHKTFKVNCGSTDAKPSGAVHAGGGGVPPTTGSGGAGSSVAAPLLVSGAVAAGALVFLRRVRRRVHGVA